MTGDLDPTLHTPLGGDGMTTPATTCEYCSGTGEDFYTGEPCPECNDPADASGVDPSTNGGDHAPDAPPRPPPPETRPGASGQTRPPPRMWAADELMAAEFPPPTWTVPGLVCEGLNLLAGAPKVGKSWLALAFGIAVASGGSALGKIAVEAGDALVLALEDTPRRIQDRLGKLLGGDAPPPRLTVATDWPRADEGGTNLVDDWLGQVEAPRLVVVDVLARFRPSPNSSESRYEVDYQALAPLKDVADRHGVAALACHHTRKQAAEDWLDTVLGSQALAGAADATLLLTRSRGRADGELKVTGRDVEERELALEFDGKVGTWSLLGDAAEWAMSETRQTILRAVRDGGSMAPKAIAEATGIDHDAVKHRVRDMVDDGQLGTDGAGHYHPLTPVTPVTPVTEALPETGDSDSSDESDGPAKCAECGATGSTWQREDRWLCSDCWGEAA